MPPTTNESKRGLSPAHNANCAIYREWFREIRWSRSPKQMLQCVDNSMDLFSAACWWLIVWIHSQNALQGSTHALYFAHHPA